MWWARGIPSRPYHLLTFKSSQSPRFNFFSSSIVNEGQNGTRGQTEAKFSQESGTSSTSLHSCRPSALGTETWSLVWLTQIHICYQFGWYLSLYLLSISCLLWPAPVNKPDFLLWDQLHPQYPLNSLQRQPHTYVATNTMRKVPNTCKLYMCRQPHRKASLGGIRVAALTYEVPWKRIIRISHLYSFLPRLPSRPVNAFTSRKANPLAFMKN